MSNLYFLLFLPVYIFTSCFYNSLGDNREAVPLLKPIFDIAQKTSIYNFPPIPTGTNGREGEAVKKKKKEFISFVFFECLFF